MLGANRLSFKPMSGFPSVGLNVGARPWQITSGKWYYEVTIVDMRSVASRPQFGWSDERFAPKKSHGVGDDAFSWGVDGQRVAKWHGGRPQNVAYKTYVKQNQWGQLWKAGDILGCMADLDAKTLSFSLNGSTEAPMGIAFENIEFRGGILPALSAKGGDFTCNFGGDPLLPLSYLPEDYSPVAGYGGGTVQSTLALFQSGTCARYAKSWNSCDF